MARTSAERAKASALDASLRKMFKSLEGRPVSPTLTGVIDQLNVPPLRKAS